MLDLALALLALAGPPATAPTPGFSATAWTADQDIYQAILRHPFLAGLEDGSLPKDVFAFYLVQDAHYLDDFSQVLGLIADKAPKDEWAVLLRAHARGSLEEKANLHQKVFEQYGLSPARVRGTPRAPDAFAYSSFLLATAYRGSFGEALAAVLPCYRIYGEVGAELQKKGSPVPSYQKWIDNYSSADYERAVEAVEAMADEVARTASPEELVRMRANYRLASRYEWMFWNAAYRRQAWPPPGH
jgi:thiaminase (transcriptional activator TenA)